MPLHTSRPSLCTEARHSKRSLSRQSSSPPAVPIKTSPPPQVTNPILLSPSLRQGPGDNPNALARGIRGFGGFFFDAQGHAHSLFEERGGTEQYGARARPVLPRARPEPGRGTGAPRRFRLDPARALVRAGVGRDTRPVRRGLRGRGRSVQPGSDRRRARGDRSDPQPRRSAGDSRRCRHRRGDRADRVRCDTSDRVRPVVGGLQINFPGFLCTLGFNAVRSGQNSFITNSHCTNTQGGTESTPYWQPLETVDPARIGDRGSRPSIFPSADGCPNGRRCRFSDASRAAYAPGIPFTLGTLAKTSGANNGSITSTVA